LRRRRNFVRKPDIRDKFNVNGRIRAREVRLVGDNIETGVYTIEKALALARELETDLVEISPNAKPPVCKIMYFQKFIYEKKKKEKEIKNNTKKVVVKEIRMGPNTDEHDFNFKLKHAINFLQKGEKVKAFVFFKGRTIVFKERGELLLLKFIEALQEYGTIEQMPKLEGKRMIVFIQPKK